MDVKEAAKLAKEYVADLFADEGIANVGLEEIQEGRGILEGNNWVLSAVGPGWTGYHHLWTEGTKALIQSP